MFARAVWSTQRSYHTSIVDTLPAPCVRVEFCFLFASHPAPQSFNTTLVLTPVVFCCTYNISEFHMMRIEKGLWIAAMESSAVGRLKPEDFR